MSFFACTRRPGRLLTSRHAGDDGEEGEEGEGGGGGSRGGGEGGSRGGGTGGTGSTGSSENSGDGDGNGHFDGVEEKRRDQANVEYKEIVRYLLSLSTLKEQHHQNHLGETMLTLSAKYGMESLVVIALSTEAAMSGELTKLTTKRGENALHYACRARSVRIVWLLRTCAHPLDESLCSRDGLTPLEIATSTGDVDMMDCMLAEIPLRPSEVGTKRARRWEQGGKGRGGLDRQTHQISLEKMLLALHTAARFGRVQCLDRLITKFKCPVNRVDKMTSETSLMIAIKYKKKSASELLKRRGVPLQIRNKKGLTAMEMAKELDDGGRMVAMLSTPFL